MLLVHAGGGDARPRAARRGTTTARGGSSRRSPARRCSPSRGPGCSGTAAAAGASGSTAASATTRRWTPRSPRRSSGPGAPGPSSRSRPSSPRPRAASWSRCAHHRQWRFPHALKNQINWNAQLYASVARMTGNGHLLRARLPPPPDALPARRPPAAARACPRPTSARATASTTAPSWPRTRPTNFDTPEYAHIVATTLLYHREARAAGMKPLPRGRRGAAQALDDAPAARQLDARRLPELGHGARPPAACTPASTGRGACRACSRSPPRASSRRGPSTRSGPRRSSTAGCGSTRAGPTRRASSIAPQLPFDMVSAHRDHDLYASRMAANAMRAIRLGLGGAPSVDPPSFYAYDRELQRLAVSTPRVLDGDRAAHARRVPVRRDRARAPARPARRGGRDDGRRPARRVRRRRPRRRGPRRALLPARAAAGREPAAAARPGRLRLVQGAHRGRARSAPAGVRVTTTHTFRPRVDRRALGRPLPRRRLRAATTSTCSCPTWGETATIDGARARPRRSTLSAPGALPVPLEGVGRIELGMSPASGYAVTDAAGRAGRPAASRPARRGAAAHGPAPRAGRRRPDPPGRPPHARDARGDDSHPRGLRD